MANLTGFRMPMEGSKAQFRMPGTVDPTKKYLNQPYSGMNLRTHTASAKLKYDPSDSWHFEGGYQVVKSYKGYVYSVNNTFNDNNGGFRVSRRSSSGVAGQFDVSSWYAMATTSFETASLIMIL